MSVFLNKIEDIVDEEVEKLQKFFSLQNWEFKLCPDKSLLDKKVLVSSEANSARMEYLISYVPDLPGAYEGAEDIFFEALKKDLIFEVCTGVTGKVLTMMIDFGIKRTSSSMLCAEICRMLCSFYKESKDKENNAKNWKKIEEEIKNKCANLEKTNEDLSKQIKEQKAIVQQKENLFNSKDASIKQLQTTIDSQKNNISEKELELNKKRMEFDRIEKEMLRLRKVVLEKEDQIKEKELSFEKSLKEFEEQKNISKEKEGLLQEALKEIEELKKKETSTTVEKKKGSSKKKKI